jgi:hypothetical protein
VDARIPFFAQSGSRPTGRTWRSKRLTKTQSAIEMAPALHLLHETGGTETKTEGTTSSPKRTSNAYAAVDDLRPEAAQKKKGRGGSA